MTTRSDLHRLVEELPESLLPSAERFLTELAAAVTGYGGPSKYLALTAWLGALPATQQDVCLSFDEIAAIIGEPLPESAYSARFWTGSIVADLHWRSAGFSARFSPDDRSVRFRRTLP